MFENTLRIVEEAELTWLHVFPYSLREGTPAARMPGLPRALVRERAARLREVGEDAVSRFLDDQVGKPQSVLVEQEGNGRSAHYAPVRLTSVAMGKVVAAKAIRRDGQVLIAEAVA